MAEHIEVARAFVTIVPSLEGSQAELTKQLTGATTEPAKKAGEQSGKNFGQSLAKGLKTTAAVIGAAMATATAAAVGTGKAFINAANDVAAYGDKIDKNSQKMGISKKAYQEWDYILQHSGASIDGMKTSMLKLTKAAESGDDAFKQLGISQNDLKNMNKDDLFAATIKGLQNVKNEGQRTVLANKLLGKGATELGALLNSSASDTEKLRQKVHDLGGVMSDEAVSGAAKYQDSLQDMKTALTGVKNNMMSKFLPGLSSVMDGLAKVFSGDGSGIDQVKTGLQSVVTNIQTMAPKFMQIASVIVNSIIQGFGPMLPQLVTSLFSFITQAITTITAMIPQLMPAIIQGIQGLMQALMQALPVIIQGLITMTTALVTWLASNDNVKKFADGIVQLVSTIAKGLGDVLPVLIPAIVNIIGQIAASLTDPKNVKTIITSVLYIVGAIVVALVKALPEIGKVIVTTTRNILTNLKNWGGTVKTYIGSLIGNVKTAFTNWLNNLKTSFANGFNNIKTNISNILGNIGTFVASIINKVKEIPGKVVSIGKDLVKGLWNGISDKIGWVKDKIKSMGESITKAIKKVFGIHSPSKLWRDQIGANLALGIGAGFTSTMDGVRDDMVDSMSGITANMSANVTAYGSADALGGTSNTYNGGNITLNIYGAEGQNVNDLANIIAVKLQDMTNRRGAVYA